MFQVKIPGNVAVGTRYVAQWQKICLPMQETQEMQVGSLDWEYPLEEEMATCSSILAWRIPRTEEPGGLQSTGSQRVRHDWAHSHTSNRIILGMPWWPSGQDLVLSLLELSPGPGLGTKVLHAVWYDSLKRRRRIQMFTSAVWFHLAERLKVSAQNYYLDLLQKFFDHRGVLPILWVPKCFLIQKEMDRMYPMVGRGGKESQKVTRAMGPFIIILRNRLSFIFPNEVLCTTLT